MCGVPTISGCPKSAIDEITIHNYNELHIDRSVKALIKEVKRINKNRGLLMKAKANIVYTMHLGHSWDAQARAYARLFDSFRIEE